MSKGPASQSSSFPITSWDAPAFVGWNSIFLKTWLSTFAGPCHGGENYQRWPRISTLDLWLTASTRPTNSSPLIPFASDQPTFSTCHFRHFLLCSTFNPAPYPHNSPAMLSNSLSPYFSEKKWFRWKPQHLLPSNLQATCTCPKLSPCMRKEGLTPLF